MKENYLPDGEWKGFYVYSLKTVQHKMNCCLLFADGVITGSGSDDIGAYKWSGTYNQDLDVTLIKSYPAYSVTYLGNADENGIWGTWQIIKTTGGFHIWPVAQKPGGHATKEEEAALELSKT